MLTPWVGQKSPGGRDAGAVRASVVPSQRMACSRESPHISSEGGSEPQTAGRSGWPKMAQRRSAVSWMQRTPAGLPCGMPGIGLEMEGAMQHAPQSGRQFMGGKALVGCGFIVSNRTD